MARICQMSQASSHSRPVQRLFERTRVALARASLGRLNFGSAGFGFGRRAVIARGLPIGFFQGQSRRIARRRGVCAQTTTGAAVRLKKALHFQGAAASSATSLIGRQLAFGNPANDTADYALRMRSITRSSTRSHNPRIWRLRPSRTTKFQLNCP